MSTKNKQPEIPQYVLGDFRHLHRQENDTSDFGYNNLEAEKRIPGFEVYSSEGLRPAVGPLKSDFYRISITLSGGVDVQLGLEKFRHQAGTLSFTFPGQVFSKDNIAADTFGYYILFNANFLEDLLPAGRIPVEFPFFDYSGVPFIQLDKAAITAVADFVGKMNEELRRHQPGCDRAVQMYLYLLLLEVKRSYIAQELHLTATDTRNTYLVPRFKKLVSQHFLTKKKVADYAELLGVTPNHLNRTVKEVTGHTASAAIADMLVQEAKAVLRYTDTAISEISYQLNFSDPAGFNRFFREQTGQTPLSYRKNA
ncbi:MAG: helix-turn-helix domain-containing protein [Chitinophaga sp.]|uniref:helix-turn-helix domain-containing protein n=1 Tax=Chitinophaga sp. TaxID=1869181 RepID=UPI001B1DEB31|nr:helix-turn-helix domain-containing protein [Chitinophaga sp.]MBO9732758.1 helix-turn-helix domain-containing protein [Chitinophaga sp.]